MVKYGTRVSELLAVALPCGGHGKCGKCKVRACGELSPLTETEKALLTENELSDGVRLACHTLILGACRIEKLSDSPSSTIITSEGATASALNPTFKRLGLSVDIGTTTLAARLVLPSGKVLSDRGSENPQAVFGADVVSRLEAAERGKAAELTDLIKKALNRLIAELCADAGKAPRDIDGAVITGNTAMLCFLTAMPTDSLSRAPFTLPTRFGKAYTAHALGLNALNPDTEIYIPPCISAFLGADTVCAILAAESRLSERLDSSSESRGIFKKAAPSGEGADGFLLADLGTNGEIVLKTRKGLYACSTAAGPAFEGVGISSGMNASDGAIDKVTLINGKMHAHVIGGGTPQGICGSGLIDAAAALLDEGELDESGTLSDEKVTISSPVTLTAEDIRALQVAKSAVNAGICTLFNEASADARDISAFFTAGGLGNYLNTANAARTGLFPTALAPKAEAIGNAALSGSTMLLLNASLALRAREISEAAAHIELSSSGYFSERFISGMRFPSF